MLGLAWLGLAWLGLAWLGLAWLGLAWVCSLFIAFIQQSVQFFSRNVQTFAHRKMALLSL